MDSAAATHHPIGHAHQIPVAPSAVLEKQKASNTRRIKSVKVAIINFFIIPAPLKIPSATNFAETTK